MVNNRATETDIADLHGKINRLYLSAAETLLESLESDDDETRLMAVNLASPQLLTSMSNWVKQNNVTCQPEEVKAVDEFAEQLKQKRKNAKDRGVFKLVSIGSIAHGE